ncbi:MAG TPA: hypothetical protein VFS30_00600 [Dehalococcoidia bacterium]|nr:hypothetical protein [Dehalococcoidia bacterium]
MRLRAVGTVSIKDRDGTWLRWSDGEVFDPPSHMNVKRALERGVVVEAGTRRKKEEEVNDVGND